MKFDWQPKTTAELSEFDALCKPDRYKVVEPDEIPAGTLSPALLEKCHSVLVVCSGTETGRLYWMLNLNRIDEGEIDQNPYAIAFDGEYPVPSGLLVQHGDYNSDRTIELPPDFDEYVAASGIYPLLTMPVEREGSLEDLRIGSQEAALQLLVREIRSAFPE